MNTVQPVQQRMECVIRGRVQRVMFRDFVQRNARHLCLVGRVRNEEDGSVSVIAEGEEDVLRRLYACLHRGSFFAKVDAVEVRYCPATGAYKNFSIE